ncbi:MAG: hypothetical protein H6581_06115 [Bacteroidia bacterium]|nr:hypothetical protein [Bacteroidia bacterium]
MKKHSFFLNLASLVLLGLSSCVKCETCTALDTQGEVLYEAESCGRKSVRDEGKTNCENIAAAHGGTCGCVKGKVEDN